MAFGTLNTGAQEELSRRLGGFDGVIARAVVIRRGMVVCAALSGQQLRRKLIEGLVGFEHVDEPLIKFVHAGFFDAVFLQPQQVTPFERPEPPVFRSVEQVVDQSLPPVRLLIGKKRILFRDRGQLSNYVQINATHEFIV